MFSARQPASLALRLPLVVVAGPTASGKSALAIALARSFGGEIVNCDSQQVYRGLDIGTAKLAPEERQGIPHYLIDVADPAAQFTAADFARLAEDAILTIENRGRLPILCGGTGFYLRSLLEGLSPAPTRDAALRERLSRREQLRPGSLHRVLSRLSPELAARIHPNDVQKTLRALEVRLLMGVPWSNRPRQGLEGHTAVKLVLAPPTEDLDRRILSRTEQMFQTGLVEEVGELLACGVPPTAASLHSIGYRQAAAVLRGELTYEQAIQETALRTRQYAKRQRTWFRAEREVIWIEGFGDSIEVHARAVSTLQASLFATPGEPSPS